MTKVEQKILTVSQLTQGIKRSLEGEFSEIILTGELSNFKAHVSGHWYFNMKDSIAAISCTMWKGMNNYVFFTPKDGMNVVAHGRVTVYPPRGQYQFEVRSLRPAGVGELQAAFELLKQRLSNEGLFDAQHKKKIPDFPSKIGLVTASDGAAFSDLISVAERRYPVAGIVLAAARVQGAGAAGSIAGAIMELNRRKDIDIIIVARGGGSIEDLWAFNEEVVARAIFNSRIPVITGIGHEVDVTIADYVADLRAATPTAAMEIATPDKYDLFAFINEFSYNSSQRIKDICTQYRKRIQTLISSYGFRIPNDLVKQRFQQTDHLLYRISRSIERVISHKEKDILVLSGIIRSHDVKNTLKKGFAIVKQDSRIIKRSKDFTAGTDLLIKFYDNEIVVKQENGKEN
jgi:exodeoxyribonuclease VII large subunit